MGCLAWKAGLLAAVGCAIALVAASPAAAFEPLGQRGTGTAGGAAGQLSRPYQPAVDAQGNLFVADSGNRRISEFAPDGSFIKAFGKNVGGAGVNVCTSTCHVGTNDGSAGSMGFPDGLAIDPVSGNLVVGDELNNRVAVFTPDGTFVRAFGQDVNSDGGNPDVCTTSCQTAIASGDSGAFNTPVEIAIDLAGNVFVGDEVNNRIDVLTLTGGFQRAFGADVGGLGNDTCTTSCAAGTFGDAAGQLTSPSGVALDGAGNVFVGEWHNDRVSVFTTSGAFERAFGGNVGGAGVNVCTSSCVAGTTATGAAGELAGPFEVGFDPATGEVLIPEGDGDRVSAYTPAGAFVRTFGQDVDQGGGTGFEICTTLCKFGTPSTMPGAFNYPSGVTVDCRGTVYASEDAGNRVQLLGEAGVQQPPCPSAAPPSKPSNAFSFGKLQRNRKRGTAILPVTIPGPGAVTASGKNASVKQLGTSPSTAVDAAATEKLRIKAKGKAKKKLNATGKAKLKLVITFTPTGGDPASQSKPVKLIKRL
jgi:DNA-binding beta-propeller fold protein YncE